MVHSITLQTSDSDISDGDILGQIGFAAPVEGTGSDANLLAASIFARSEGDFSSSNNATELVFATSATESSKPTTSNGDMVLSSTGTVTLLGGLVIADGANIGSSSDTDAIAISSGGVVTMNQIPVFSAGINVSGGTIAGTLATAAQGNVTSLGTLTTLTVDNVIIDGTTIGHTSDTDLITLTSGVVTVAGELDATSLDISGNADIDGTLEADAITVDGVALATYIRDTVGTNMLSSNTESGITVTYDTSNDNIDFAIDAAQTGITSLLAADIKIGEDDQTKIDFETADEIHFYAANVEQVYLADNIFGPQSDSDVDLGTTGVRWKDAFVDSITVTGEIDGASLDISGNADIDGTLEADAITVDGATLSEYIADTAGAMFTSNTETGITVTYQDGDNTVDLAIDAAQTVITSLLATDIKIGEDDQTKIDFEDADKINFYAANEKQLILEDGALYPGSDNIIDLGKSDNEFKDAYFDGTVTADAFAGPLTGDVTGTADLATSFTVSANNTANETVYPVFVDGATGTQGAETDTGLTYNPSTGQVTALKVQGTTSIQTALIEYTDGDDSMTIADGGKVTFGNGFAVGSDQAGDILYHNGTSYVRLAIGSDGQVLTVNDAENAPGWENASGGGSGDITGVTLAGDSSTAQDLTANVNLTLAGGNGITTAGDGSATISIALDAALTTVTSLLATDIKIGEDDQTKIDFETADEIHFYAANVEQVYLADNVFGPQSDSDVDLGTTGVRWKDAYIDTITTTGDVDVLGNIELGHASDTTIARASSGQITVEGTAVILAGAVTGITSLLATDIKIGEDDQTKIDFETANEIHFYANNTEQVYLADNIFGPQSDSDVDLGTTGVRWKDAYIDTITTTGTITAGGIVTGTGFTAGSAVLAEAELELLDGLTAGTAIASKVVTTDANIDTTGQRNLTISGELDAATLDISGNADIDGTTNLDAVDIDGNVDLDGTLTIGAAQDGYDFKVFGNGGDAADSPPQSPDKYFMWDESADGVRLRGNFVQEAVPYSNTGTTVSDDSGATINIDWQKGNYHWIVLAANVTKIIFQNMKRGGRYILRIEQHSSSPKTVSWGNVDYDESNGAYTEVSWVGGTAPTMTNTAGRVDVYGFLGTRSNGRGMDGFVIAQNVAEDGTH